MFLGYINADVRCVCPGILNHIFEMFEVYRFGKGNKNLQRGGGELRLMLI